MIGGGNQSDEEVPTKSFAGEAAGYDIERLDRELGGEEKVVVAVASSITRTRTRTRSAPHFEICALLAMSRE